MRSRGYVERSVAFRTSDRLWLRGRFVKAGQEQAFVLLLHGITVTRDEWLGFYEEMAVYLAHNGISSLRFDFRGHGQSDGTSLDVSVIGEVLDIRASLAWLERRRYTDLAVVATSFAAGPALLAATSISRFSSMVLIAPVLDYNATFLRPETPWAKRFFTDQAIRGLAKRGFLALDQFKIGPRLVEEFRYIRPLDFLGDLSLPILLIHGDCDSMVPYRVSAEAAATHQNIKFFTLEGADHGFPAAGDEAATSAESIRNKLHIYELAARFVERGGA